MSICATEIVRSPLLDDHPAIRALGVIALVAHLAYGLVQTLASMIGGNEIQANLMVVRRPHVGDVLSLSLGCLVVFKDPSRAWLALSLGLANRRTRALVAVIARADHAVSSARDNDTIIMAWMLTKESGYMDLLGKIAATGGGLTSRSAEWASKTLREQYPQWV